MESCQALWPSGTANFQDAVGMCTRVSGKTGKNLFSDNKDPMKMSDFLKSYIAGQLLLLPEILPMFAPTINSYKRLVEGAWAPTTITWGIDNRNYSITRA